jgi:hypothetical protein
MQKLRLEILQQKNWHLHHDHAPSLISFFTGEFLTQNNMTVVPHPPYFPLFPRLKIKLKGRQFYITEVIGAESQAVLNTLTEHDFQDALKMAEALGTVHTHGRRLFRS